MLKDMVPRQADEKGKDVILKNCLPFNNFTTEIDHTQIENVKDFNVAIPMHNLIIDIVVIIQKHWKVYVNIT